MAESVLVVGNPETYLDLEDLLFSFVANYIVVTKVANFLQAIDIVKQRKIDLMIVLAYNGVFASHLDEPICPNIPIIYIYNEEWDKLPKNQNVISFGHTTKPSAIFEQAMKMMFHKCKKENMK